MITSIYTDGGTIGPNPSPIGGTWAYCFVDKLGERIYQDFGVVVPESFGLSKITNNFTELYAAVQALRIIEADWQGTLFTDSGVTLFRLTKSNKFNGIPRELEHEVRRKRQLRKYRVKLLGGHPSKQEVLLGKRRDGKQVSIHNVWCDLMCQKLSRRHRDEQA